MTDANGKPAANAVVALANDTAQPASHVPPRSVIDQQHETFLPLVVLVRKGGEVVFTNNDTTMHQVYSFSAIKQFQFEIDKGQVSKPVIFDKAGVAAIGCNIHDNMVAYVFVADAPYAAITDAKGTAELRDVPDGAWHASVWHPQSRIGKQPAPTALAVAGDTRLALKIQISAAPAMSRMHKDY
ncbi:MAG: methylamine utilization protein [Alphaproteobacteria bacterium]|nr:methylamine utilization protein [Alphaproteobacteria bacterium]